MAYEQLGVNSCWRIDLNKQGTSQWSGELAAQRTTHLQIHGLCWDGIQMWHLVLSFLMSRKFQNFTLHAIYFLVSHISDLFLGVWVVWCQRRFWRAALRKPSHNFSAARHRITYSIKSLQTLNSDITNILLCCQPMVWIEIMNTSLTQ